MVFNSSMVIILLLEIAEKNFYSKEHIIKQGELSLCFWRLERFNAVVNIVIGKLVFNK